MTQPLLYISYGMAKSGSTLAYQILRNVLENAGAPQVPIPLPGVITSGGLNFVEVLRPQELHELRSHAERAPGLPIAIKTHCGMWDCVRDGLDEGWIIGHAVCRDPRDIALSMMDASRNGRAWGQRDGEPLRHIEDAMEGVRFNTEKFQKWASHPAILPLTYARIGFDTKSVARQIADQLGVDVNVSRCANAALKAGTNLNKGVRKRYDKELSPDVSARIGTEFANFIDVYCDDGFEPPKQGVLSRLIRPFRTYN